MEEIKFIDADSALEITESIIAVDKLIVELKAYLFDVVYIQENYKFELEERDMSNLMHWVRTTDVKMDEDQYKVLKDIEKVVLMNAARVSDQGYKGLEEKATLLWRLLEDIKVELVKC